jgi:hypothetical protein
VRQSPAPTLRNADRKIRNLQNSDADLTLNHTKSHRWNMSDDVAAAPPPEVCIQRAFPRNAS